MSFLNDVENLGRFAEVLEPIVNKFVRETWSAEMRPVLHDILATYPEATPVEVCDLMEQYVAEKYPVSP